MKLLTELSTQNQKYIHSFSYYFFFLKWPVKNIIYQKANLWLKVKTEHRYIFLCKQTKPYLYTSVCKL